ncbi:type II toxin-antitoxin system RelE family toxin [Streptomyces sp. NPDC054784]
MASYQIRYTDRAATQKNSLPQDQKSSLKELEKRLKNNPYQGARSNRDNSWSADFTGGFITYIVSNNHLVINVINVVGT